MNYIAIDVASLAWLLPELGKTLGGARIRLAHASSVSGSDTVKQLNQTKRLIHEATGALQVITAKGVVHYLQCLERAVDHCIAIARLDAQSHRVLDDACYALLSYLHELQSTGVGLQPLVLYPQYKAVCDLGQGQVNAQDCHPVDLFFPDLSPRIEKPASRAVSAPISDLAKIAHLKKSRPLFQSLVLKCFKDEIDDKGVNDLAALIGIVADHSSKAHQYSFWRSCQAVVQGLNHGDALHIVGLKRWLGRLDLQMQRLVSGQGDLSERLFREALFYIAVMLNQTDAQARPIGDAGTHLQPRSQTALQTQLQTSLVKTYRLTDSVPAHFAQARYGLALPIDTQPLLDQLSHLKQLWDESMPTDVSADGITVSQDEWLRRLRAAHQCALGVQLSLSEKQLDVWVSVVKHLVDAIGSVLNGGQTLPLSLGLEGAKTLLWLDESIKTLGIPIAEQQQQAHNIRQRLNSSRSGMDALPTQALNPRGADQALRSQAVQEVKNSLALVEKQLDDFFRYGQSSNAVSLNLAPLAQAAGALRLIELPQISAALHALTEFITEQLSRPALTMPDAFKQIATLFSQITGALDEFSVAPVKAQQMYVFDAPRFELRRLPSDTAANDDGEFESIESFSEQRRANVQVLARQALDNPHDARTNQALAQTVQAAKEDAALTGDFELTVIGNVPLTNNHSNAVVSEAQQSLQAAMDQLNALFPSTPKGALAKPKAAPVDDDLHAIFIAEAQEVLADLAQLIQDLETRPHTLAVLKDIRRGFHTLKGSARMVGFKSFGDAAWHIEQTVSTVLSKGTPASIDLIQLMRCGRDALQVWLSQLDDALLNPSDAAQNPQHWAATGPAELTVDSHLAGFVSQLAPYLQAIARGFERQAAAAAVASVAPAARVAAPSAGRAALDFDLSMTSTPIAQTQKQAAPAPVPPPQTPSAPSAPPSAPAVVHPPSPAPLAQAQASEPVPVAVPAPALPKALDAPDYPRPSIRLVANNEGMRPQDFIDKARAAVQQAMAAAGQAHTVITAPAPVQDTMVSIGPLRLPKQLYAIYVQEAGAYLARLRQSITESQDAPPSPAIYDSYKYAHSLKGGAATIGFSVLKEVAAPLEHVLQISVESNKVLSHADLHTISGAVDALIYAFKQFSRGVYPAPQTEHAHALLQLIKALDTRPSLEAAPQVASFITAPAIKPPTQPAIYAQTTPEPSPLVALEIAPEDDLGAEPQYGLAVPEAIAVEGMLEPKFEPRLDTAFELDIDPAFEPIIEPAVEQVFEPAFEPILTSDLEPDFEPIFMPVAAQTVATASHLATAQNNLNDTFNIESAKEAEPGSTDEIDEDIWFDFEQEAEQLLPRIQNDLTTLPVNTAVVATLLRDLHTLKGSARMAGAMRMGAMVHAFESKLDTTMRALGTSAMPRLDAQAHNDLLSEFDAIYQVYEALSNAQQMPNAAGMPAAAAAQSQNYAAMMAQTSALFDDALSGLGSFASAPAAPPAASAEPMVERLAEPIFEPTLKPTSEPLAEPTIVHALDSKTAPIPVVATTPASQALVHRPTQIQTQTHTQAQTHALSNDTSLPALRMRTDMLDHWVNQATEVAGSKGRLDQHIVHLRQSLREMTDNVERLRKQLREIEIQAESQLSARTELASSSQTQFDPLEFDRFTRFQELTRMLNESLSDMLTVRDTVAKTLSEAEQDLLVQSKASKDLTQSLIRSRLVAFDAVSDRLYRVARQASRELGKQVALDIQGGHFTLDRSILERMTAGLEHLVRNSVVHGIEAPEQRKQVGKNPQGTITIQVRQQGNELEMLLSDDGAGLPLERIRDTAIAKGLLDDQSMHTAQQLADLIFVPGFSTADGVTELAGRGVGMDVVRSDILALGGRIHLSTTPNESTRFTLRIPLTLAMSQVLMVVAQDVQYAIPSSLVQTVVSVKPSDLAQAYSQKQITQRDVVYPFAHLSDLLNITAHSAPQNRSASVVLLNNGSERVAIHVDMVVGNQEAIVKPLSTLMSRIPGLSSATLLNNGGLCLILNPVQLWPVYQQRQNRTVRSGLDNPALYAFEAIDAPSGKRGTLDTFAEPSVYALGSQAPVRSKLPMAQVLNQPSFAPNNDRQDPQQQQQQQSQGKALNTGNEAASEPNTTPVVMVVDDSITVRKVTQKLLLREGWEVLLAKDGIDALEQLQTHTPHVMLVDIEMPRMDGFDLTRNVRADDRLKHIPIIMITSRIADKHRDHAISLGVNAYMGKPYRDDELLAEMKKLARKA